MSQLALFDTLARSCPSLERGEVWCIKCGRHQKVDTANSLRRGWPKCCGHTMTIDSPTEREIVARDRGMELAAAKNAKDLAMFKQFAVNVYWRDGDSDIERAREWADDHGYDYTSGNWMGSVYGKRWAPTGRRTRVRHKLGHARTVGVWRLK